MPLLSLFSRNVSLHVFYVYATCMPAVITHMKRENQPQHYGHRQVKGVTLVISLSWHLSVGGIY